MNGLLIYDSVDVNKNQWFINHFIETAKTNDISLELFVSNDFPTDISDFKIKPDFVINRSRNYSISSMFEDNNIPSFNSSEVIKIGNDKNLTYRYFKNKGIPYLPYMYITKEQIISNTYTSIFSQITEYPLVAKPSEGHGGAYVSLINNEDDLYKYIRTIKDGILSNSLHYDSIILQKCASDRGKDLRVYILNGKIVAGILRKSESDFRANFSLGGNSELHVLSEDEICLTNKIISSLSSDFIGIDFVYNNQKPILNEIEDAVGCRMLYANTNIDIIPLYINHIKNSLKTKKP